MVESLHDIGERNASYQRPLADQGQVQKVPAAIVRFQGYAAFMEVIVVIADQVGLDDLHELAEILTVGRNPIAGGAQGRRAGVRREQVDVGQLAGSTLADIGYQLAQRREIAGAGLVDDEGGVRIRLLKLERKVIIEITPRTRARMQ